MAVIEYQSEDGERLWKAYVSVRSKTKTSVRVQRWKFGCKTQKIAEREEANLLRECHAEVLRKENQGETWGSLVENWELYLKDHHSGLNESTRKDYIAVLRKHTAAWWKRPANEICRADVIEVLEQAKANGTSNSHQNVIKVIINRVFTYGIDHRIISGIERSPAHGISLGREEEKKPEILNIQEIKRLLSESRALKHSWYPVWAMAVLTGCRNGELNALLWTDVDWENREINLTKSYNTRTKKVKSTKAGYWRKIPISSELMGLLTEIKADAGNRKEILPRLPRWNQGEQARILREFCAGIGLPSIKFHTLRACFATQLIRNGVPPIQIQKICGWRDLETMQRYIRLAGIEVKGATDSLQVLPAIQVFEKAAAMFTDEQKEAKAG
jgi:integrase